MPAQPRAFQPVALLRALTEEDVDFVLIGGFAGNLLGSAQVTYDTDVAYARDQPNLVRLLAALQRLDARLRVGRSEEVAEELLFQLELRSLENGMNFTFSTRFGPFDVLGEPPGIGTYEELRADATMIEVADGLIVPVASLDHLIAMKRAAARPKDKVMLEEYIALADERRARGDEE